MRKLLLGCAIFAAGLVMSTAAVHAQDPASTYVLINKSHPLQPPDYTPASLVIPQVLLANGQYERMRLTPEAAENITSLFKAARHDGITLVLSSGYRSYDEQAGLYADASAKDKQMADQSIARPGYSEHQSGLAADVITDDYFCATEGCFAMTKAAAWLHDNSYKYGFTVRYPLHKEASTGYEYEPWHLRYLGVPLADQLYRNDATLEESLCLP
jgi:zinc D-Ala-D-Ala carboxypeptidase